MRICSLYFPLILSFLSFLDSIINSVKQHIHSFLGFATAINTSRNIATDEHKLYLKSHFPISASEFISSTESLSFDGIDERQVEDDIIDHEIDHGHDHYKDNNHDDYDNEDDDGCCYDLRSRMRVAEGRQDYYPPPLSSLNRNGRPNFFLRPVRKNGRLILTKVRMKSHKMIYSSRQNGRLRLYLVPDDDDEEEELVGEVAEQKEEEMMVDSDLEEEEEEDEEIREEIEEDKVGEWNYGMGGNEGFRRCHQVMNPCYHGSHQNLHMYGLGIA